MAIFLPIWMATLSSLGDRGPGWAGTIRLSLSAIMILLYAVVFVGVLRRMRQLRGL